MPHLDIQKMHGCVGVCVWVSLLKKTKITLTIGKMGFNKEPNKFTNSLEELGKKVKKTILSDSIRTDFNIQ